MIIDVHTYLWNRLDDLGENSAARVESALGDDASHVGGVHVDRAMAQVSRVVVLGAVSRQAGLEMSPRQTAEVVKHDPHRLIGFAGVDPLAGKPETQVDQVAQLQLHGVTISPQAQRFHPTHSRAMRLYEQCAQAGLPVVVLSCDAFTNERALAFGSPMLFDEVASTFADLKLVIAGLGGPFTDQTFELLAKHENVYADVSGIVERPWQLYHTLLAGHERNVLDKILFGSGYPFCTPERAITNIYSINVFSQGTNLPSVPRQRLRAIVECDALSKLGIGGRVGRGEVIDTSETSAGDSGATVHNQRDDVKAIPA